MEPFYKEGERVEIKEDLAHVHPFRYGYMPDMPLYEGSIATIKSVTKDAYDGPLEEGEDGAKYRIDRDNGRWMWPSTAFKPLKDKKYETRLQEKRSVISRGDRPEGSIICSRRSKATIEVGHLSYTARVRE